MSLLIPFLVIMSYLIVRQVWFRNRKINHLGVIEKINLCIIYPDVFLTEVEVHYKYYFGSGVYSGKGYTNLYDFLDTTDYRLYFNSQMMPVLSVGDKTFVSEEHIESYLINQIDTVSLNIDPIEPYRSKFIELYSEPQKTMH